MTVETKRKFVDGPFGQVHVRLTEPTDSDSPCTPLVLFHPTPASGHYFAEYAAAMAQDRLVIAIDTPGYGDSVAPTAPPSIEDYAASATAAINALGYGNSSIDVLGYHTGGLTAVELARTSPQFVRKLVLPGLPYFDEVARAEVLQQLAVPDADIEADAGHLRAVWEHATIAVHAGVSLARAQELYVEEMKAFPDSWWGYRAAFTYDAERAIRAISQPVLLISTAGALMEETRAAAEVFSHATYVHLPEYTHGVFMVGTEALVTASRDFLDA